jgi:hypothetical protein
MDNTEAKQKEKGKTGCLGTILGMCCGCGCAVLLLGFGPAPLIPFFFPALFTSSGEHLPNAEQFSPEATNFSYYETFMHCVREFDIPEKAFLEMCKKMEYKTVAIETLPYLPPDHEESPPRINYRRTVPLTIVRYVHHKEEHQHGCDPWNGMACHVEPSGRTDDSCFRSVSKGYYFEHRLGNGGGLTMLYDSENGRCYMHWNHH